MRISIACLAVLFLQVRVDAAVQWTTQSGGNGHWYDAVYVPQQISWTDARDAATAQGGYLATIQSAEENEFVFNLISDLKFWRQAGVGPDSNGNGPWLGGSDLTGPWQWVNGDAWTYDNWGPEEPNHQPNEYYLAYFSYHHSTLTAEPYWNDSEVNYDGGMNGYVVEFDSQPVPEPTAVGLVAATILIILHRRHGFLDAPEERHAN